MASVSIKQARENLRSLLNRVAAGEEIFLLRRGKEVARLSPPRGARQKLPSLDAFRRSISVKGRPSSDEVVRGRREERY
ncbi:MAG: type II toxin-antitoxin system Phd/YefM family antitoxin [Thermoanaerobaculia bacterium]